MSTDRKSADYYPLRWKVADAAEDLLALHRGRALLVGLLLVAAIALGTTYALTTDDAADEDLITTTDSGDGSASTSTPASSAPSTTASTTSSSTTSTTSPSTTSSSSTTSTTATTVAVSERAPTSEDVFLATEPGSVVLLDPAGIDLVGGLPSDAVADETLALVSGLFPDLDMADNQVVDDRYPTPTQILFRLSQPDLFEYNRDTLNAAYTPLVDQLGATLVATPEWNV
ncbi:MAG: hypothetical protein ACR2P0_06840, partial [Acidimicrobiales bacterium]